jgi:preprotein translocase subunit YajC
VNGGIIYLLVFAVIAFMLYTTYSQQRRAKKAQEQLQRMVKKGDEVLTVGGLFGTVRKVGDDYVVLEIADRTKVRFLRRAIREIVNEEEDVDEDEEEYVEDEYDEGEYVDGEADDEDEESDDDGDEESDDDGDEESDDEAEDDDEEVDDEAEDDEGESDDEPAADDAVDEPADDVQAPKPPSPPKGS